MTNIEPPRKVTAPDVVAPVVPTQVAYPWKATLRTIFQSFTAFLIGLIVLIPTINGIAPEIGEALKPVLPPEIYAYVLGAIGIVAALAGTLSRLMAIPEINALFEKIKLGAEPKK